MGLNLTGLTGIPRAVINQRIPVTIDNQWKILTYGINNLYPQETEQIRLASPLVKSSTEILEDFLNGSGWELNGNRVINRFGETMTDILNLVAKDAARYSGAFSIHINFDGTGTPTELQHIPFMYCRMIKPGKDGRIKRVAVSDNWEQSSIKETLKPIRYNILNPLTAGNETIQGGKGQILYFTGVENGVYPTATFDSIINTAITDPEIQLYEKNNVLNGFHGAAIVHYPATIANEQEKSRIKKKVDALLGSDGPGAMVMSVDAETDKPLVETIQGLDTDDLFTTTLLSVRNRVTQTFRLPQALLGISPEGAVFSQNNFFESYNVYNIQTRNKRNVIARAVNKVTDLMDFEVGPILENDLGTIKALPNDGQTTN